MNTPGPMIERSTWEPDTIDPWHKRLPSTNVGSPLEPKQRLIFRLAALFMHIGAVSREGHQQLD